MDVVVAVGRPGASDQDHAGHRPATFRHVQRTGQLDARTGEHHVTHAHHLHEQ
ncbi:hypothetical protein [Saccharothrix yanglingensis]|uniref:hypothetical protein n=1 Tax=Saccharothrix yanglingensis TaxID=659496 RepID=UPI0027D2B0E7|nr:hypothetical protein [Saccharothrix yanglingensis]